LRHSPIQQQMQCRKPPQKTRFSCNLSLKIL
jgi:hypothetical protein